MTPPSDLNTLSHAEKDTLIAALFAQHRGTYGAPRITADLREMGWRVSQNTVAAIMAEQGLQARAKRRRRSTTRPGAPATSR